MMSTNASTRPVAEPALWRPDFEHDACGIGALAHLKGRRSHQMVDDALSVLVNLEHRGGAGLERNSGDGSGILIQIPHRFFRKEAQKEGRLLPDEGDYGVAMLFLPRDEEGVASAMRLFEEGCAAAGLPLLFWREVPIDPHDLGQTAKSTMPRIYQAFVGRPEGVARGQAFERRLYVCRRSVERAADADPALDGRIFYVCSMSARTVVYKGMLVATQMRRFYPDLEDAQVESAICLVHSRFSTNTTPSWERAHPNRYLIHNGEINTLKGNVSWIRAREPGLYSPVLGEDLRRVLPIINREGSDSAILDNVLEFLVMNGMSLERALTLLIPEPWDKNANLSAKRRDYDAYQSMLMEPWDGPAAVAYTDGVTLGAALDRNGLRPARYYLTRDDRFILASEVGVLDIDPADVLAKGCLGPGEMIKVDTHQARLVKNDELRDALATGQPYGEWVREGVLTLADVEERGAGGGLAETRADGELDVTQRLARMGFHYDDIDEEIRPMAEKGAVPLASMGYDIPLACLSERPRSFFDYFWQLFAQVTNPPIDALRESMVTSTTLYVGNHGNLLEDTRENCRLVRLEGPIIDERGLESLASLDREGLKARRFSATFERKGPNSLEEALEALCAAVEAAVREGVNVVVVSDRLTGDELPIPSLLATGAIHCHLLAKGLRTHADLVVEAGDAVNAHDAAALVGYSASAVCPYMAHEAIRDLCARGAIALSADEAVANYDHALTQGIVSIASKMGISTMQGYHSAQIFEAVGIAPEVIERCFRGTTSRVGGLGFAEIQRELEQRVDEAEALAVSPSPGQLRSAGLTKWRPLAGEDHLIDPQAIYLLQRACAEDDFELFRAYALHVHPKGAKRRYSLLRDLLDFVPLASGPVPLDEVEPASEIVKRFNTGAMSYGSISKEAHETLAIAMNRLGGRSNTGEGGEDPARETPLSNGDSMKSAIKQVASGRFGVTSRYLMSAAEIQIKMAQGAKPGEGGHLPGGKVYPWIADVRRATPGVGLISPPPHHDIYSIEDLAELIFDLKNANPKARVSVKLVAEGGVGTIATGVAKGGADKILISGSNGGTGAAPRDSIYHAGLPLELGLAETQQTLLYNGLRSRVVLEADGKLMTGRDVAVAALLGAEEFGFATMPLVAMGCLMQRDCQQDTCPAGICTQNQALRCQFHASPEHVERFMTFIAEDLRRIMAELGFRTVDEMVGHPECLAQAKVEDNWKAATVDLSELLSQTTNFFGQGVPGASGRRFLPEMAYDMGLAKALDATLFVPYTQTARERLEPISFHADISNVNRCVGTQLGAAVTGRHPEGLPEGSLAIDCEGSGGQSFGAFLPAGITLAIEGDACDYFGKGLSGGIVSVRPPEDATFRADENAIIGNVAFYGATSGKGFVNGLAGQRFAVRNSGATLVVEGVGNHGCEYMTGGTCLIIGEVGENFACGMSGGVAYVLDAKGTLEPRVNKAMVEVLEPSEADLELIRALLREHAEMTRSPKAIRLLFEFDAVAPRFKKVIPTEYREVMEVIEEAERDGKTRAEAEQEAFEVIRQGR